MGYMIDCYQAYDGKEAVVDDSPVKPVLLSGMTEAQQIVRTAWTVSCFSVENVAY